MEIYHYLYIWVLYFVPNNSFDNRIKKKLKTLFEDSN